MSSPVGGVLSRDEGGVAPCKVHQICQASSFRSVILDQQALLQFPPMEHAPRSSADTGTAPPLSLPHLSMAHPYK